MRVYCSPTWTSPEAPTSRQSDRRPSSSGAGGVSASTLAPAATSSRTTTGMAGQLTADDDEFRLAAKSLVDGAHRRHAPAGGEAMRLGVGTRDHGDDLEPVWRGLGHADKELGAPAAPDDGESDRRHWSRILSVWGSKRHGRLVPSHIVDLNDNQVPEWPDAVSHQLTI